VKRLDADVCVVGAGFAGLTAALRLRQAGLAVVVLEARDRLGGRVYTQYLADGTAIERGGAWLGPGQDRAYALVAEMGAATYPTWVRGENVLVLRGTARRYRGNTPLAIGPVQLVNLAIAMTRLDRMASKVPLDAPWDAAHARRWDGRTVGAWLDRNMLPGIGRALLRQVLGDVFTSDPAEVSLLAALFFRLHNQYTGSPNSTITIPRPDVCVLYSSSTTMIPTAATIYKSGSHGYPNARYGRSAFGLVFRNTNTPRIVSA
jgi:monoamine oxidase